MYRVLMATEPPTLADELRRDLIEARFEIVAETDPVELAQTAVRSAPDLVISACISPSNELFEAARLLGVLAPCPVVLFTSDGDSSKIERASSSGVHAYVVNGYAQHRLVPVVQVARARFRHERLLKEENAELSKRLEERKLVDRAKGVLTRSRGISEDQAFALLRGLAMRSRQRIGVVAESVVNIANAGDAVNRAGQLRMLSQRIVKCYAQILSGMDVDRAGRITADCIERVESTLVLLRKAITTDGYAALVDRVWVSWTAVKAICDVAPKLHQLGELDGLATTMLSDAEDLTKMLESSGLVASLHILNVAGRQRMVSQQIAKLCFMLVLEPGAGTLSKLRELAAAFQSTLSYLSDVPLSTPAIRTTLAAVEIEWSKLSRSLRDLGTAGALADISDSSEKLLEASERLTDEFEQAMQTLIGDQIGRIA